jgi:hypothetical protein
MITGKPADRQRDGCAPELFKHGGSSWPSEAPRRDEAMLDHIDEQLLSLATARERVTKYMLMSVEEVAEHYQVSRSTVDQMPPEILPYVDLAPTPKRQLKRYHPLDVLAAQARLRTWRERMAINEGDEYLRSLQDELEARDARWIEVARQAGEAA